MTSSPSNWNYADIFERIARNRPDGPAQKFVRADEDSTTLFECTWGELDERANNLGNALRNAGLERQDKVAQYLYNCPQYLESVVASFKASLVPVNTNYRYVEAELLYLWDNADVRAVVFHGTFVDRVDGLRAQLPDIKVWLWVDDGTGPCPAWATPYEVAATMPATRTDWERSGDDLWLLYTGGTTGMPKGVMWRQDDLWHIANNARPEPFDLERNPDSPLDGLSDQMDELLLRRVQLPACPLMHGTGFLTALGALAGGGCVVTLENRKFDAAATLDAVEKHGVEAIAIVGDAFARPILQALDAEPGRWDLSKLEFMVSSGVMWSAENKQGLLRHHPTLILSDGLGSSESIGMGRSESTGETTSDTAKFELGDNACLISDDGRKLEPGDSERGRIAVAGHLPVGYYKDEEKSRATFPVIDGVRYSIAGDYARLHADGSLELLGRGSVCINSGGEKIFPEEVEEVLKRHDAVRDAVCVGLPDERFGECVNAVVECTEEVSEAEIISFVRASLAAYKAPRRIFFRDSVGRSPSGKADYGGLKKWASEQLA